MDDQHYCLKCKKIISGLDNYIAHRKAECSRVLSYESPSLVHSLSENNASSRLHEKELDESFVNDVIDLSTSTRRVSNDDTSHHQNIFLSDVSFSSASVPQHIISEDSDDHDKQAKLFCPGTYDPDDRHSKQVKLFGPGTYDSDDHNSKHAKLFSSGPFDQEDHNNRHSKLFSSSTYDHDDHNSKQAKLFSSAAYVETYGEVDNYSALVHSRDPALFHDFKTSSAEQIRKDFFPGGQNFSGTVDLLHATTQESSGSALFRSLESFSDHLKSPQEMEHSGYFSHFSMGKCISESQNYGTYVMSDNVKTSYRNKTEVTLDNHDSSSFQKHYDAEKIVNKCAKDVISDSVECQKNPEDIRQHDFLSSLELTSNVSKKIMKYASDDEEDDYCDESRPPKHHTGGKWPPGSNPPSSAAGKWLLSPTSAEEDEEPHIEFDEIDVDDMNSQTYRHPPPLYTKGKWLPGKRMTNVKYGTSVEYTCKACNRTLKGKTAYERHLRSELHFVKENKYFGLPYKEAKRAVVTRPQRAKKLQANTFLKETISLIKSKKSKIFATPRKRMLSATPAVHTECDTAIDDASEDESSKNSKILCPICRLSFSKEYCSRHFASLAHIHNELEYRLNPNSATDDEYSSIICNNIEELIALSHFKCILCKFYTNSHEDLVDHIRLHQPDSTTKGEMKQVYMCSACEDDREALSLDDLKRHLQTTEHAINVKDEVLQAHQVRIRCYYRLHCPLCERNFRFNRSYKNHRRNFHGDFNFKNSEQRILYCSECSYQGTREREIREHIKSVHKLKSQKLYFCFVCGLRFPTSSKAENHRQSVSHRTTIEKNKGKPTTRRCYMCYAETENLMSLRSHMTKHHPKEITPCPYCGILPPLRSDLTTHLRNCCRTEITDSNGAFSCELCGFSNDLYAHVLMHVVFAHSEPDAKNNYTCHICKVAMQARSVKNHMLLHTTEWKYACKYCSRKFAQEPWLLSHIKIVHSSTGSSNGSTSTTEPSSAVDHATDCSSKASGIIGIQNKASRGTLCEICGKTFKTKSSLRRHQHGLHIFDADRTRKKAKLEDPVTDHSYKSSFTADSRADTEERNISLSSYRVICDLCGIKYTSMSELRSHQLTHRAEGGHQSRYTCPHCSYATPRLHHLKRHLRLHTGATPFLCPYCSYAANNQENLRKHMLQTQKHSGRFMYECQLCLQARGKAGKEGAGSSLPFQQVFGSNYASQFKVHLNGEHKDHFRDKDEILRHIRSYYHSDQDATFTDNPKPFHHKPRKRQARCRMSDNNTMTSEAVENTDLTVSSGRTANLQQQTKNAIMDATNTTTGNITGHQNVYINHLPAYKGRHGEESEYFERISDNRFFQEATVDIYSQHHDPRTRNSLTASSNILPADRSGNSTNAVPSISSSAVLSSLASTQIVNNFENTTSNSGCGIGTVTVNSGNIVFNEQIDNRRYSKSNSVLRLDADKSLILGSQNKSLSQVTAGKVENSGQASVSSMVSSVSQSSLSSSTYTSPTTIKVYVNKGAKRAYIVKDPEYVPVADYSHKLGNTSHSSCSMIAPTSQQGCHGNRSLSPVVSLSGIKSLSLGAPKQSRELNPVKVSEEEEQNLNKKIFLIFSCDKGVEEQVIEISPSPD